jgi:hypothetical protein
MNATDQGKEIDTSAGMVVRVHGLVRDDDEGRTWIAYTRPEFLGDDSDPTPEEMTHQVYLTAKDRDPIEQSRILDRSSCWDKGPVSIARRLWGLDS